MERLHKQVIHECINNIRVECELLTSVMYGEYGSYILDAIGEMEKITNNLEEFLGDEDDDE